MTETGFNFGDLVHEAKHRWLKSAEVYSILQNHENLHITPVAPNKPPSGSLFLFNKRVTRFFRKDGHRWRRKKDGRAGGEAHEKLKVGNVEALNCYYAHGEENPKFQRRSYWILDPAYEHIVLVHYLDISQGKQNAPSESQIPPESFTSNQSPSPWSVRYTSSTVAIGDSNEPNSSPGSVEISSFAFANSNGINQSSDSLEEQLSMNYDSLNDIEPLYNNIYNSTGVDNFRDYNSINQIPYYSNSDLLPQHSGDLSEYHQLIGHKHDAWKGMVDGYGKSIQSARDPAETPEDNTWFYFNGEEAQNSSMGILQQTMHWQAINTDGTNPDQFPTFDQDQIGNSPDGNTSLTNAQKEKFRILDLSPDWGYADEATKVIIVGSFLCGPSENEWTCMFGDIEVPLQIIREGVICCQAPPHLPGKVTFCITTSNHEACSEVREFEYRVKSTGIADSCPPETPSTTTKNTEELLLLVRFAKMLLSDESINCPESGNSFQEKIKASEDSWSEVIQALLVGSSSPNLTIDWILQELLKDKLQQWLSSKLRGKTNVSESDCILSKKEQGVIHMIAGLGFEWALCPILHAGVTVNFRDINGWTALHWAARFGREKMVAALIASSASAGAVTDPTKQDPTGQTPAAIAARYGHKGLAGYLSEVLLTSHLSSLTLEEAKLSYGAVEAEAESTVGCISETTNEDQLSLKDSLAAARNAAQAAARIQAAFRAHSFRKRQQREANAAVAAAAFRAESFQRRQQRDYNSAALTIQKNYRGWSGRKRFLDIRQKVVKIQAHVRGYQVRKEYKVCWATGILEKLILRWRRRGVGLRGFHPEVDESEEEEEDILKVFRKQKVDKAIDEAVSRVLSMVESTEARQQYRRLLEKYRQAKAKLQVAETEAKRSQLA